MTISKKQLSLLALPLLATGVIGVAALATNQTSAATPSPPGTQTQTAAADTPEANDKADAPDTAEANEPKHGPDTDNVQDGPQDDAVSH